MSISILFALLITIIIIINNKSRRAIEKIAYVDPVTGGFTTARFDMEIKEMLNKKEPFTFISLDIKGFKLINDSFGANTGDKVLKHIQNTVASIMVEGEYICRTAADTFNLVIHTSDEAGVRQRMRQVAEKVNAFNKDLMVPYYLPIDVGGYIVDDFSVDIVFLRDRANTARKYNKGRNDDPIFSCSFYDDGSFIQSHKEKRMENLMELALENQDFKVFLQPKVDLKTGRVAGAEALVRWFDPEEGMLPPADFIPFFERNRFILKLDMYVFEEVCRLIRAWIDSGISPVSVSVNVSRVLLRQSDFLLKYKKIREKYQIPTELLELEITETMVFENLNRLKSVIEEMHSMGFICSMDDFGSGYSSLNVLKEVPVDILKLDRVFFDREDDRSKQVIKSVVSLAKSLGMKVVSEGIETATQADFLKQVNCDMIQGYYFSPPVDREKFEKDFLVSGKIFS